MNEAQRREEIREYTQGLCVVFAVEAARMLDGEPVFITDDGGETGHAMCQLPDGRLFDIRGAFGRDGSLHEHCPADYHGLVFIGRNLAGRIEHETMGLPEPALVPLSATRHGGEYDESLEVDRILARQAAERVWAGC